MCPKLKSYGDIKIQKIGPRSIKLLEKAEVFGQIIPEGFISDGASVPRLFWCILDPFAEGLEAALLHDYRYRVDHSVTRSEADLEFYRNLRKCGLNIFRRGSAYLIVRSFGWMFYSAYNIKEI